MKSFRLLLLAALCTAPALPVFSEDNTSPNFTYFTLRRDFRRCASPFCGGFFVKKVNHRATVCADGVSREECYVAELDLAALGLKREQEAELRAFPEQFLLRGRIAPFVFKPRARLGTFHAQEAWQGHADATPSGTFFRARNNNIVCVTFPCLSFTGEKLNSFDRAELFAGVDLAGVVKDPSDGYEQLDEPEGLMVAGRRVIVVGPAGRARALEAREYYVPFTAPKQSCGSRGQLPCPDDQYCLFPPRANCGRADGPGTCVDRPTVCTGEYDPVCGCDGVVYSNACQAAAAGVSVDPLGDCPIPQ